MARRFKFSWLRQLLKIDNSSQPPKSGASLHQKESDFLVQLCPCITLSQEQVAQLDSRLRSESKAFRGPWHQCSHIKEDTQLTIEISLYLSSESRSLVAKINYSHTAPMFYREITPMQVCPHRNLDAMMWTLHQCRMEHSRSEQCADCRPFWTCEDCSLQIQEVNGQYDVDNLKRVFQVQIKRVLGKQPSSRSARDMCAHLPTYEEALQDT